MCGFTRVTHSHGVSQNSWPCPTQSHHAQHHTTQSRKQTPTHKQARTCSSWLLSFTSMSNDIFSATCCGGGALGIRVYGFTVHGDMHVYTAHKCMGQIDTHSTRQSDNKTRHARAANTAKHTWETDIRAHTSSRECAANNTVAVERSRLLVPSHPLVTLIQQYHTSHFIQQQHTSHFMQHTFIASSSACE